jgi:hypothetical protein
MCSTPHIRLFAHSNCLNDAVGWPLPTGVMYLMYLMYLMCRESDYLRSVKVCKRTIARERRILGSETLSVGISSLVAISRKCGLKGRIYCESSRIREVALRAVVLSS